MALLRRAIAGQHRHVAAAAALHALHQAGEALVPVLIGVVIDRAVAADGSGVLAAWLGVLAAVFAVLSYSFRFGARAGERAAEQSAHELRLALTRRVLDPRGGPESGHLPGELASLATADAQQVGALNRSLPYGIAALTGLLVTAIALLRISIPLGLAVLLGAPPLLWLAHLLGRPMERRSGAERERAAHASGIAADLIAGLRVLKGLRAEPAAVTRYRCTSQESLAATIRAARAQAWHDGGMLALNGIFLAIVALIGGRLATSGTITVGELVAAVGLAQFLLGPLTMFASLNAELAQARASARRITAVLATPPAAPTASRTPDLRTTPGEPLDVVTPDPATAAAPPAASDVGRALDLRATPGEPLDVVTPDPATAAAPPAASDVGRTPDLRATPGEPLDVVTPDPATAAAPAAPAAASDVGRALDLRATAGELLGVVTPDPATAAELLDHLAGAGALVAPHDAHLFESTVLDNVASAATLDPRRALAAARADALPDGDLTERGRSLSGGQRQRVALARALAADPPVLVLHDPTTAVDAVTEAAIATGIRDLRRARTTIILTTSPALLAVADRVVLIEDGAITAEGTHAELAGHAGYRKAVLA
ncbi:MAG TPA: ABC transporter ATP-binding protein [Actinophytocola sp.]|uniref:ABC transporter ATP-binding protein n=1 Tax=Actinophytocola sp. TaxID=1872138 RepID=UPI002DDD542A|nr:ABC transporter ATP-binding protein [Actinophytocola sp.]HEV2782399.1 ABC transporter ATP-binding protein [Actinophytocola sp.]